MIKDLLSLAIRTQNYHHNFFLWHQYGIKGGLPPFYELGGEGVLINFAPLYFT